MDTISVPRAPVKRGERGPRPTEMPGKLKPSKFGTTPEHRLREQMTEMIGRGDRTMERWRRGER